MRRLIIALALLVVACGGRENGNPAPPERVEASLTPPSGGNAPFTAAPAGSAAAAVVVDWVDPEPPDAQARAEAVVNAAFNADKSTLLTMHITTLVDRTSGIEGFASALAAREVGVDERLDRLGARITDREIVITLSGSVLFDFDKTDVRPDAERTLAEVSEVLKAYGERPVRVEGHTDAIASDAYNQALSERRAAAVATWLAAHGVGRARIATAGFGESRPVSDNATADGRQQNRRVEIVIGKNPS